MFQSLGYTYSVDIWGLGLLIYECLTGINPFIEKNKDISKIYKNIKKNEIKYPDSLPEELIKLLKSMINTN